ncbi:hypothetical protein ABT354_10100 [Streptomyces sp. NPDC000594]|uniref:hypothetical protein n=1 Tax=Streptomyces sp. NPDC000594 TaxID=3154261 RepID=UPI003318410B
MSATTLYAGIARTTEPRTALRRLLALDAVVTGVNAVAYLAASGPLARLLGVDRGLLLALGAFLVLYAAAVGALAARRRPAPALVTAVIDANLAYAVVSFLAPFLWLDPSTAGAVWTPLQGAVVGLLAVLQLSALRAVSR